MATAIRFHLDEHLSSDIANALGRSGIDITTTVQAGLRTAPDATQWDYAQRESRVIVTCDTDFLLMHKATPIHSGIVFFAKGSLTMREIIEGLTLIHGAMSPDEIRNRIEFL